MRYGSYLHEGVGQWSAGMARWGDMSSSDSDTEDWIDYNSFSAPGRASALLRRRPSVSVSHPALLEEGEGSIDPAAMAPRYVTLHGAAFHIFKGNVGAGVFLLPAFYQDTGYLLGLLCVVGLGVLMVDCALALLRAKNALQAASVHTYPAVVDLLLGRSARLFTEYALIFTQFGFCIIYIQYAASLFAELSLLQDRPYLHGYAYEAMVLLCVLAVTPLTFLTQRMSVLADASLVAGVCVAAVLAGTTLVELKNLYAGGVGHGVRAVRLSPRLLLFLSGHMFSLEGVGVVLPVETSLAPDDRPRFAPMLRVTLSMIVLLYIAFGVLGYVTYGDTLTTSVLLALPPSAMRRGLQCVLGVSLVLGYPIQYVPAIQLVDKSFGISMMRSRRAACVTRFALNALFGLAAVTVGKDTINIFAGFLGAFAGVHLMITIPALLALQTTRGTGGETQSATGLLQPQWWWWQRGRWWVYVVFGLIVWVGGLYDAVASLHAGRLA